MIQFNIVWKACLDLNKEILNARDVNTFLFGCFCNECRRYLWSQPLKLDMPDTHSGQMPESLTDLIFGLKHGPEAGNLYTGLHASPLGQNHGISGNQSESDVVWIIKQTGKICNRFMALGKFFSCA